MTATAERTATQRWVEAAAVGAGTPAPGWLQALKADAASRFAQAGLPDRKTEDWKYTPVSRLESLNPPVVTEAGHADHELPPPVCETAEIVVDINGDGEQVPAQLPPGLSISPLLPALDSLGSRLRPLLEDSEIEGRGRAFEALNLAMLRRGLVVRVAAGSQAGPVLLRWNLDGREESSLHPFRIVLLLEEGARLELVEQYQGSLKSPGGWNVVIQAELGERAILEHSRFQLESEEAVLLTSTRIEQSAGSRYVYAGFDVGGALVRHELRATLRGPGAQADLNGAYVLDGRRYADNHVSVDHASGECTSSQFFRGVLGGRSRGVFNGRALIREGADGSVVRQSNANLLLSPLAEIDTKPELEIYADEVEASHGATVGQLDEAAIFYLRSRGLSDRQARRMLTGAFCRAVTERMRNRELAERAAALLDAAMPGDEERPGGVHRPGPE